MTQTSGRPGDRDQQLGGFTTGSVATALGIQSERVTKTHQNRIATILVQCTFGGRFGSFASFLW
jgi:hypothetical protein